jgi:hypothetical protein
LASSICHKDFQDVLQLAERIPFELDLFEKPYHEELREYTTGRPEDNAVERGENQRVKKHVTVSCIEVTRLCVPPVEGRDSGRWRAKKSR